MASRYSAARPNREGENFVRTHHLDREEEEGDSKRIKFDARNPSKLAADAREDDAMLDADVIRSSNTKRGAVNLDGYDSDSDADDSRDNIKRDENVNLFDKMDNYDKSLKQGRGQDDDDEDDDDMFAPNEDSGDKKAKSTSNKKDKSVRFMDESELGEQHSTSHKRSIRLDDQSESSEDEEDAQLRMIEEDVDEEVGLGGLKRNAPKIEAFNLKGEMEEGRFDEAGNYIRKAGDPDAVHDNWLEGVSKKEMKKAAEAHEKREAEERERRMAEDQILVSDLLGTLISRLEKTETPMEAMGRITKLRPKPPKRIPQWKLKKMKATAPDPEAEKKKAEDDLKDEKFKVLVEDITGAATKLQDRNFDGIWDLPRETLAREYRRETGKDWVDAAQEAIISSQPIEDKMWEYRWTDGRDRTNTILDPFNTAHMRVLQAAGQFDYSVADFREVGGSDCEWTKVFIFLPFRKIKR